MVSCSITLTGCAMAPKAGPFTFAELQTVTSLGRGEIRECINRGIISASAGVGQGHHRAYSKWNLVEGAIAAALLRHLRAGSVEHAMTILRSMLEYSDIDPDDYCIVPDTFEFSNFQLSFPGRLGRTIKPISSWAKRSVRPITLQRALFEPGSHITARRSRAIPRWRCSVSFRLIFIRWFSS